MASPLPELHLKRLRQSQKDRQLCWAVGAYLRQSSPDIFEALSKEVLSTPNSVLASLLYNARSLHSRDRKRFNSLKAVEGDNTEALEALAQVREGLKGSKA